METEINNLRQNVSDIKAESEEKIEELQNTINNQNISAKLAKKKEKIAKLKEKLVEVNSSNAELFASVKQLKDFLQNQMGSEDSLEEDEDGSKKENEKEIALLKERYASLTKDYDDLYIKFEALTEENKKLKEGMAEKERLEEWNLVMKSLNKKF